VTFVGVAGVSAGLSVPIDAAAALDDKCDLER
jgi:hypothetical protein